MNGQLLTVSEVCEILGVHENTVYRHIADGNLIAFRLGGSKGNYRITESALQAFLNTP